MKPISDSASAANQARRFLKLLLRKSAKVCSGKFSDHFIKRYIPRIWLDFLYALAFESYANELWSQPMFPVFQECKTAIEVCAAHTYSISVLVKRNDRRYHKIEFARRNLRTGFGLPESVPVAPHFRFGCQFAEHHHAVRVDDRCEHLFLHSPCFRYDGCCIDFIGHWHVARERPAGSELVHAQQAIDDGPGSGVPVILRKRTARRPRSISCAPDRLLSTVQKRLPHVPLQTVALEPEQQVGPAVAATGLPQLRPCSNAANSTRPRVYDLGSKGNLVGIEHRRRRQLN